MTYTPPSPSVLSPREREHGWANNPSSLAQTRRSSSPFTILCDWLAGPMAKDQPIKLPVKESRPAKSKYSATLSSIAEDFVAPPAYAKTKPHLRLTTTALEGAQLSSYRPRTPLGISEEVTLRDISGAKLGL